MKNFFFISLLFLSSLSCKEKNNSAQIIAELNPTDTFLFEFPKHRGFFDSSLYKNNLMFQKSLGLQNLEKGFDSIQIRIHYGGAMVGERLVVLSNTNNKWTAEISRVTDSITAGLKIESNDNSLNKYIPIRTIEYRTPKSGWNKFINQLLKFNILTLPDQNNIKNFQELSLTDGVGVDIEIALKNVYRCYGYSNPEMYPQYQEAKKISNILDLIDEEFGLQKLWDYTNQKLSIVDTSKIKIQEITLQEVVQPIKKKKRK